jgi:hypothetical protein
MILFYALALLAAGEAPQEKIAVLDMQGITGVEAGVAQLLTETLTGEVARASGAVVLGRNEISSMLGFEKDKMLIGCSDDLSCVAEIGGALGVDRLVRGTIGKIGDSNVLNVQIINIKKALVEKRVSRRTGGGPDKFLDLIPDAVNELFSVAAAAPTAAAPPAAVGVAAPRPGVKGARPWWPWVVVGGGALGALVGGGVMAVNTGTWQEVDRRAACSSGLNEFCAGDNGLDAAYQEDTNALASQANAVDLLGLVTIVGGSVAALTGLILAFALPDEVATASVTPVPGGAVVAVRVPLP